MINWPQKIYTEILARTEIASNFFRKDYRYLYIISDYANWSLDHDARELLKIAQRLNIKGQINKKVVYNIPQCVHYATFGYLNDDKIFKDRHRISFDYFHGRPGTEEKFTAYFNALRKNHEKMHRLRVSTKEMEAVLPETGIDKNKIFRIPIGINLAYFQPQTTELKIAAKRELGIPKNAVVIGSFQKDGQGWGDGLEPKMVKGPDVFIKTLAILKNIIPELFVLLTGPARGYVKKGLDDLRIPYIHKFFNNYEREIGLFYQAIDLYIITSRQEGGPKAFFESLASGVPLVSTKVGQVADIAKHEQDACLVDVEDYEGLAHWSEKILSDQSFRDKLVANGLKTAADNTYEKQIPLWQEYFKGFIEY